MALFTYDNFVEDIGQQVKALRADYASLVRGRDECRDRFGQAPAIPKLVG